MNRRIFFKRASQALVGVAASLALGKFTDAKLLWEGDRNNIHYFSYSDDWACGRTAPGGIMYIHARHDGRLHNFTVVQSRELHRALASRNWNPSMSVAFAYNLKTKELRISRIV